MCLSAGGLAGNIVTMQRRFENVVVATRSLVASEGWSLVRDRTNRKQCPSHKIWSYKRDGRW